MRNKFTIKSDFSIIVYRCRHIRGYIFVKPARTKRIERRKFDVKILNEDVRDRMNFQWVPFQ